MLYVPLDSDNNLTVDFLVDSGTYVSAIDQNDFDTIKQNVLNNILKIDGPPYFQIQVANSQLEKPLETATLIFENGDDICSDHSVLLKKLSGPFIGLHFMTNNSVAIDKTHGLKSFSHFTMQIKTASNEKPKKPWPD